MNSAARVFVKEETGKTAFVWNQAAVPALTSPACRQPIVAQQPASRDSAEVAQLALSAVPPARRTATVVVMIATTRAAFVWSRIVEARARDVEKMMIAVAGTVSMAIACQRGCVARKVTAVPKMPTAAIMLVKSQMEKNVATALT